MALTKSFYEAVENGNVRLVRIMMKDSLIVDPSFGQFDEMEKAAKGMLDLYEPHDGRDLEADSDKWDEMYMNKLMVQVISNFSRERVGHLKKVVRHLQPASGKTVESTENTRRENLNLNRRAAVEKRSPVKEESYQERKKRDQREGTYLRSEYVAGALTGAVIGGTAGAVVGMAVAGKVIIGGVAAGAAVGAAAGIGIAVTMTGGDRKDE